MDIWLVQELTARLRPFLSNYVFVSVPVFHQLDLLFGNLVHLEYLHGLDSVRHELLAVAPRSLHVLRICLQKLFQLRVELQLKFVGSESVGDWFDAIDSFNQILVEQFHGVDVLLL